MVKLTEAQWNALRRIAGGKVTQHNTGYGAWRIQGASPTVVGRLVRTLRLAEWQGVSCVLTEAGRDALAKEGK